MPWLLFLGGQGSCAPPPPPACGMGRLGSHCLPPTPHPALGSPPLWDVGAAGWARRGAVLGSGLSCHRQRRDPRSWGSAGVGSDPPLRAGGCWGANAAPVVCRRPVPRPPPVPAPPFCSTKRCPGAGCGPGPGSCGFVRGIPGDLAGPALPSLVRGCGPGPGRAPGAPRPRLPPTRGAGPNPYTGGSRAELGGGGACPPKGCSRGGV